MTTLTTDPRHGRALIWQRALQRWLTRSSVSEVLPCLYLGGSYAATNPPLLASHHITFVLTIMSRNLPTSTLAHYHSAGISHLYIPKHDSESENLLDVFGELCRVLEERLRMGEGVLVHCAMGVSRSVSVVIAYVMQRYGIPRSAAKRLVRAKRNVANPNAGFYAQLKVWEACRYDIQTAWAIDGVRQLKVEYRVWLEERGEEERREEQERRRAGEEQERRNVGGDEAEEDERRGAGGEEEGGGVAP